MPDQQPRRPVEHRLLILRRAYADQLPHRISQIEKAAERLNGGDRVRVLRSIRMMAHSLAGSAALFGYGVLSSRSRELSQFLARVEAEPNELSPADLARYVIQLRRACVETESAAGRTGLVDGEDNGLPFEPSRSRRLLFLVSRNSSMSADLSFQLGCFGYLVRTFLDSRETLEHLDEAPAALIIDAEPFAPVVAEAKELGRRFKSLETTVPLVLLSSRPDLQSRLEAVRARVDAFLSSPPNIRKLVEKLELLTHARHPDPFRVLVVEGDYQKALHLSLVLQTGGMIALLATQPDRALKELVDFQPDLVLMSVELPEVTGPELAAIIRQSDAYVHVPIVFLSGRTTVEDRLEIMRCGADDLIAEPFVQDCMLAAVSYHAQRSRALRYFLSHDSLTGVLNHTEFMQRLEVQFELAVRRQGSISYSLIDIDNLRAINERYGYMTGDGVIKSLSGLLTQRLRRTDLVGRFGGEEFAVIMPDTSGQGARRVLDEIRALFSELPHPSSEGTFFTSFTAGVAALPGYDLAVELHEDARRALALASRQGRNRVALINQ